MYLTTLNKRLKKPFRGTWWGDFLSKLKGEGLEVEDTRLYQAGDEVKNINWKLTAKTGKIYVNVFRSTKDVDFHIFLDVNINWFQLRNGKKLFEVVGEDLQHIYKWFRRKKASVKLFRTQNGTVKVLKVKKTGDLMLPFYYVVPRFKYESGLKRFLKYQLKIRKRRVILVLSDFLMLDKEMVKTLKGLKRFSEVFVHPILDFEQIGLGGNFDYLSFMKNRYLNELQDFLI